MTSSFFQSRRVLLPGGVRPAALEVSGGRIVAIVEPSAVPPGAPVRDFGELVLMPGIVDTHVHVNEPGRTEWEGFESATRAAARGGITTVVDMPLNSIPPATTPAGVATKAERTEGRCFVDVGLWGGAVPQNTTGRARGLGELLDEGVRGFKCFLVPSGVDEFPYVRTADVEAALRQLSGTGVSLMVHAEVPDPIDQATAALAAEVPPADPKKYATYLRSRPPSAEDQAVSLLFDLAKKTGTAVHVVHLSSSGALDTLARAKDQGVPLTAETAPHYLHFTAEEIPDGATWFKCAPPIRERANRERLWTALEQGLIEMVVSDHSPCIPDLKRLDTGDFMAAWGGIAGLQYSFSAVWTGARARGIPLTRVSEWMSARPARHAGLEGKKGALVVGGDADFIVFDPDATFVVSGPHSEHKNKLTPYDGATLHGVVHSTWLRGEQVQENGQYGEHAAGRWLARGRA